MTKNLKNSTATRMTRTQRTNMTLRLPEKVAFIINELMQHGYEAYAVGGCVRDCILGREPEDWDITTSANPYEVKSLFRRTVDTGIKHGTVTVLLGNDGFEVTTYRIDGKYDDCRHPREVTFTSSLKEDLMRRDFTINAMAYNDTDGLVDMFGGIDDLNTGIIRCVGNPYERFNEDALRILRAIRFSAQLNFSLEETTLLAAAELRKLLTNISAERIRTELNKLLLSPSPERLITAYEAGITAVIFPEFDKLMQSEHLFPECIKSFYSDQTLTGIFNTKKLRLTLFWALLLQKFDAKKVLQRLKFDNETIFLANLMVTNQNYAFSNFDTATCPVSLSKEELRHANMRYAMYKFKSENIPFLIGYQKLIGYPSFGSPYHNDLFSLYKDEMDNNACVSLSQLAISGTDLMNAGLSSGTTLGRTLNHLLEKVILMPSFNTRESLLAEAIDFYSHI